MAVNWNINFKFVSNAQDTSEGAVLRETKRIGDQVLRYTVEEVAINGANELYKKQKRNLEKSVTETIRKQIARMARAMSRVAVPYKYAGPYQQLSILSNYESGTGMGFFSQMSETAKAMNWSPKFNTSQSGIKWDRWSDVYAARKRKRGTAENWFKDGRGGGKAGARGTLENWLQSVSSDTYEKAFGPVKVLFYKAPRSFQNAANLRNTPSGGGGRVSAFATVGTLVVETFGRITPGMMPALASGNPEGSRPNGAGVAALLGKAFPRNIQVAKLLTRSGARYKWRERDVKIEAGREFQLIWRKKYRMKKIRERVKLGKGGNYRPALDPFVSFYLTRAIPNAIWRRLERDIAPYREYNTRRA